MFWSKAGAELGCSTPLSSRRINLYGDRIDRGRGGWGAVCVGEGEGGRLLSDNRSGWGGYLVISTWKLVSSLEIKMRACYGEKRWTGVQIKLP